MSMEVMATGQMQRALRNGDQDRPPCAEVQLQHVWAPARLCPCPAGPTCESPRGRCPSVPSVGSRVGDLQGKREVRRVEEALQGGPTPVTFCVSDYKPNGHENVVNGRETSLNRHLSKQGQDRLTRGGVVTLTHGRLSNERYCPACTVLASGEGRREAEGRVCEGRGLHTPSSCTVSWTHPQVTSWQGLQSGHFLSRGGRCLTHWQRAGGWCTVQQHLPSLDGVAESAHVAWPHLALSLGLWGSLRPGAVGCSFCWSP